MKHIEIKPGAIATFETNPSSEAIKTLCDVVDFFAQDPIETFLTVNADEIPPANRAKIRECVAKGANPNRFCPPHLRDALRRIITEAQYQARSKGKMFNPKGEYMPTGGNVQR